MFVIVNGIMQRVGISILNVGGSTVVCTHRGLMRVECT